MEVGKLSNRSNHTELDPMAFTATDDIIVVIVWTIMLIYGLIANILIQVLQVGIMRSQSMKKATSYWLILSLSVCDIAMIIISLTHIIPATALHEKFVERVEPRNIWAIFFYDLFWYSGVLKLALMAVNRFVSIVYPQQYKVIFSPNRTRYIIGVFYGLGTAVSIPTLFPCCHTVWDSHNYVTTYEPLDTNYFIVDILVNSVSLVVMIFCYAVIIMKVRESRKALASYRNTMKRMESRDQVNGGNKTTTTYSPATKPPRASVSKRETRLFLQFFIVSMVFLGTWATWQWLPRVSSSKWIFFSMTSFFFINNGINPTVYLIFNTALRKEVKNFLCPRRGPNSPDNTKKRRKERNATVDNRSSSSSPTASAENLLNNQRSHLLTTTMVTPLTTSAHTQHPRHSPPDAATHNNLQPPLLNNTNDGEWPNKSVNAEAVVSPRGVPGTPDALRRGAGGTRELEEETHSALLPSRRTVSFSDHNSVARWHKHPIGADSAIVTKDFGPLTYSTETMRKRMLSSHSSLPVLGSSRPAKKLSDTAALILPLKSRKKLQPEGYLNQHFKSNSSANMVNEIVGANTPPHDASFDVISPKSSAEARSDELLRGQKCLGKRGSSVMEDIEEMEKSMAPTDITVITSTV